MRELPRTGRAWGQASTLVDVACLLVLWCALPADAFEPVNEKSLKSSSIQRPVWVAWSDDLESGAPGWTHGDDSSPVPPRFHVDTYLAYDDPDHVDDYSWWCGELNPGYAGGDGYGNNWHQRLELPPVVIGSTTIGHMTWGRIKAMFSDEVESAARPGPVREVAPVLSFRYRHDTERGYDFVWVEVLDGGEWIALNDGYDGSSGGWQSAGPAGFGLSEYGDPIRLRFRFVSDEIWSDEDAYYNSDGGAFHVDDICVHDAITGEIYYWEDCECGVGQSQPSIMPPAGDHWHLADGACGASSGTRYWSCTHPDSGTVPPNLKNWLITPFIDISAVDAYTCTLYYSMQMFVPGDQGCSWQEWGTSDGGVTWIREGWWYADQCYYGYGPCDHVQGKIGIIFPGMPQGTLVAAKWVMLTDDDGLHADPDCPYESAGITIDDAWFGVLYFGAEPNSSTWTAIKALSR